MSYIDIMRYLMRYLPGPSNKAAPQLLQVVSESRPYALSILHATLEERRESGSPAHAHALYHIVLFTRGRGRFLLNGQAVRAQPGLLVLTGPGEPHDFGAHGGGDLAYREVTFEVRDAARALALPFHALLSLYAGQTLSPASSPVLLERPACELLDDAFRRLLERLTSDDALGLLGGYAALAEMLSIVTRALYGRQLLDTTSAPPLERARRMIERHAMERLELADVADEAHLAPAYLCRAFKVRFGKSPMAYHQEQRLQAAQRMLTTTTLSCKEIATRLDYSDVFTFSKAFKRFVRVSPARYRARHQ